MKLRPQKNGKGHITSYNMLLGSREAREAGFVREDGTGRILKKEVDQDNGTVLISVDWDAENARED